jgi:uncharacterized membrane protein
MKLRRFIEIVWLAVAAVAAVETYISYTSTPSGFKDRTYILLLVLGTAIFMYALRRRQRTKMNKNK